MSANDFRLEMRDLWTSHTENTYYIICASFRLFTILIHNTLFIDNPILRESFQRNPHALLAWSAATVAYCSPICGGITPKGAEMWLQQNNALTLLASFPTPSSFLNLLFNFVKEKLEMGAILKETYMSKTLDEVLYVLSSTTYQMLRDEEKWKKPTKRSVLSLWKSVLTSFNQVVTSRFQALGPAGQVDPSVPGNNLALVTEQRSQNLPSMQTPNLRVRFMPSRPSSQLFRQNVPANIDGQILNQARTFPRIQLRSSMFDADPTVPEASSAPVRNQIQPAAQASQSNSGNSNTGQQALRRSTRNSTSRGYMYSNTSRSESRSSRPLNRNRAQQAAEAKQEEKNEQQENGIQLILERFLTRNLNAEITQEARNAGIALQTLLSKAIKQQTECFISVSITTCTRCGFQEEQKGSAHRVPLFSVTNVDSINIQAGGFVCFLLKCKKCLVVTNHEMEVILDTANDFLVLLLEPFAEEFRVPEHCLFEFNRISLSGGNWRFTAGSRTASSSQLENEHVTRSILILVRRSDQSPFSNFNIRFR